MYSLLSHNTFGIDVYAERFQEYASVEELKTLIAQGALTTPFLHIGGGSNLLFVKDYEGLVLHSRIEGIEVTEEDERSVAVRVGAGVVWDDFVGYCVEHGWYGTENLSLIPGEVGASAVQNIGAYGVEVKDLITSVETVNIHGEERVYAVDECGPKVMGNAGSFFMNPIVPREKLEALQQEFPRIPFYELNDGRVKIPAGWMIDQCGWKGKALGPAAVHDKQALVLVNRGGAKGSDILALSDAVRASVRAKFGIDIHPEVNLVGK